MSRKPGQIFLQRTAAENGNADGERKEDDALYDAGLLVHLWQEMPCCNEEGYDDLMRAKYDNRVATHIRDNGQPADNAAYEQDGD